MKNLISALILVVTLVAPTKVSAHCQVPCGIFDDGARVAEITESIETIEKATRLIAELSGKSDAASVNQRTRWVMVKEQHAEGIIELISNYFLAQRVKQPADAKAGKEAYLTSLAIHHEVMIAAMKAKQGADPSLVERLKKAASALSPLYK